MKNIILSAFLLISMVHNLTAQDKSARSLYDSKNIQTFQINTLRDQFRSLGTVLYSDDFDGVNTVDSLQKRGYKTYNQSVPVGLTSWFQGNSLQVFSSYNGPADGYVAANFQNVSGAGNIDNWLVLPAKNLQTGDSLYFWSRAPNLGTNYPDSIRVMYSAVGDSTPTSSSWVELGRFKVQNPAAGAPNGGWVRRGFRSTGTGSNARFAIRYNVADGGTGANSDFIGIDALTIERGSVAAELASFNLVSPASGVTVLTSAGNSTPVTINWTKSASGATYNWVYRADTVSGPRLLTIPASDTSLTLTLGQIDAALAGLGLTPGQSSSGFWTVWAYKGAGASGSDSLKATTNRAITFTRQGITTSPFNLVSPPSGTRLVTEIGSASAVNISWTKSGTGAVTYKWQLDAPTFSGPVLLNVPSNNGGLDTTLTLTSGGVDGILAGLGLGRGDSVDTQWRVVAFSSATDSLVSTQNFNLRLVRRPGPTATQQTVVLLQDTTYGTAANIALKKADNDSLKANLGRLGVSYQIIYRDTAASEAPDLNAARTVILVETSFITVSELRAPYRNALKSFLNSGTASAKKSLVVFGGDFGYNYSRSGAANRDLGLTDTLLKFTYVADNGSFAAQRKITGLGVNQGLSDSTLSAASQFYPDAVTVVSGGTALFKHQGRTSADSLVGVGNTTATYNTAAVFVDPRYVRATATDPEGGVGRLLVGVVNYIKTNGGVLNVNGNQTKELPKSFTLSQNYPNPFNPTTTIQYALSQGSQVRLEVFNILGQKVATLVNDRQNAGNYNVQFNATSMASGVYFYKLQAGNFTATKKMLLVK